ncbi:MAG: ADP-forming succinate--CoA ligase subunit beta [Dehalococcoidia bacterium]|nr:ADP-forming succinate--CoA ligase subunit beta [Dehalococcoidia bacterium]
MRLYEYEGKEIFKKGGIPVPQGSVVKSAGEARRTTSEIGKEVAVKAQILTGRRGKGGGIKFARTPDEAGKIAQRILGMELEGYKVNSLLIEEKLNITNELYMAITVDGENGAPVAMVSAEGGVEIEEVAKRNPEKITSGLINPLYGIRTYEAINLVRQIGLTETTLISASRVLCQLYQVFVLNDARIAEINPLIMTNEGNMVAADSRCEIDDNSLFKHPEYKDLRIQRIENPWEREGAEGGVNYVDLEGNIAVMANGAGLTMSLLDTIKANGGSPACFLDTGGGLSRERMKNGVGLLLRKARADQRIKVVLLMVRMMISPPDAVTEGIMEAIEEVQVKTPVVAVMRGRTPYQERARELLENSAVILCPGIEEGIREAMKIAKG